MRTLPSTRRRMSSSILPSRTKRTGRMRSPSWNASVTPCTFCERRAAHIDLMRRACHEADHATVEEHRHDLVGVGEMAGADEAVVDQDRVAGLEGLAREILQYRLCHGWHGAEMARAEVALRDHDGVGIEHRGGEIVALAHTLREGSVPQRDAELVGDGDEGIPYDRQRDRIDRCAGHAGPPAMSMTRWPAWLIRPASPGRMTAVLSGSSMTAGPVICPRAASACRSRI